MSIVDITVSGNEKNHRCEPKKSMLLGTKNKTPKQQPN